MSYESKYQGTVSLVPTGKANVVGGVGILLSQNLEYRERKDLSLNVPNFESITVEVKTHESGILFCTIYRPPNSSDRDFLKNYARLLKKFNPQQ